MALIDVAWNKMGSIFMRHPRNFVHSIYCYAMSSKSCVELLPFTLYSIILFALLMDIYFAILRKSK